ncbi:hypothetical protein [Tenacibaculum aiptasiae]|uniref:hypothetical protein n=1 Tax=Tenacibaculum aiptasiae TaxID=426481 RepID=UPI00232EC788|nr:hypothetical protein [Tenacibaculum aiptasiae]
MKKALHIYIVFSLCLGTVVYLASNYKVELPRIIRFYLNDFLIIPIVLSLSLYVLRWSRGDKNYEIPIWVIFYMCAMYSVLFEFVLPKSHSRYTADVIDVILYFLGGLVFYGLQKKSISRG